MTRNTVWAIRGSVAACALVALALRDGGLHWLRDGSLHWPKVSRRPEQADSSVVRMYADLIADSGNALPINAERGVVFRSSVVGGDLAKVDILFPAAASTALVGANAREIVEAIAASGAVPVPVLFVARRGALTVARYVYDPRTRTVRRE